MMDKDDDSRLGAYAPAADEYNTFDAREEDARRGPLLLTAAAVVFVLFVGVVVKAYEAGTRERDEAARLVADVEPYRERPADPGGQETPDTNLDVYNRLTGDSDNAEDVSVRPAPEEPLEDSRPGLRVETVNADEANRETPARETEPRDAAADVTPRQAPARPEPEPEPAQPARTETPREDPPARQPDPEPVQTATALTGGAAGVDTGGAWVVQIASFRSEADAEAAWVAFRTRFSDIASGLAPDILQVDITNRGTYHRLRIAAFDSRANAVSFCSSLQERGQDCLVARR